MSPYPEDDYYLGDAVVARATQQLEGAEQRLTETWAMYDRIVDSMSEEEAKIALKREARLRYAADARYNEGWRDALQRVGEQVKRAAEAVEHIHGGFLHANPIVITDYSGLEALVENALMIATKVEPHDY